MSISLDQAVALITLEADLLDNGEYHAWLKLYAEDGRYVIPIDPETDDFEGTLNYAYDDAEMRQKRVERLLGGRSISAAPPARTVRQVSRFRMLETGDEACVMRCAQFVKELRQHRLRDYSANVTYRLVQTPDGLKIALKVIRLLEATESLASVSYIL